MQKTPQEKPSQDGPGLSLRTVVIGIPYMYNPFMNKHSCRGFTLLELMNVVGIIGVLAAIAAPAYSDYTTRSKIAEAFRLAEPIQKTVQDYRDRWGVFPADNAEAGLYAAEHYLGHYTKSIRVEQGVVLITLSDSVAKEVNGQTLHLIPAVNSASPTAPFVWTCEGMPPPVGMKPIVGISEELLTLQPRYLPATCRKPRS
jgi:type IV pilus assembly protein PilA